MMLAQWTFTDYRKKITAKRPKTFDSATFFIPQQSEVTGPEEESRLAGERFGTFPSYSAALAPSPKTCKLAVKYRAP